MMAKTAVTPPVLEFGTKAATKISGANERLINRLIERGEIRPRTKRIGAKKRRAFRWPELVYVGLVRSGDYAALTKQARSVVYRLLSQRLHTWSHDPVAVNRLVSFRIDQVAAGVEKRMLALAAADGWVEQLPGVRGGEPVIRGTRIPVYELASLHVQGAAVRELAASFPRASQDAIEAALEWAEANPRLGRPLTKQPPWRTEAAEGD